jgi:UDP-N-acetylmuramoyl-L-alanyl-D-glutamate--2,6-diaminopimelate ligase
MVNPGLSLDLVADRLRDAQLLLAYEGPESTTISGVSQDSRDVSPGDVFLAWKGVDHDAHDYVAPAVEAGAVAVVLEQIVPGLKVPQLQVSNGRLAGALVSDWVYRSPWTDLFLTGVTGTNGKSTVTFLIRHLLGRKSAAKAIGTLGLVEETGDIRPGTEGLTTPGPVKISGWLREMVEDGVGSVALEASSHALAQHRLDGIRMDAAVFTNLSQDHLDYHSDMADYLSAKAHLLNLLKTDGWAVVNQDDEAWTPLATPPARTILFSAKPGPAEGGIAREKKAPRIQALDLELMSDGSRLTLEVEGEKARVHLPLLGGFNVENALAAAGAGLVAGLTVTEIAEGLSSAPQIPGRLERVTEEPFPILIDFAHTPDALERVLATVRPLVRGRLLVLFGAGGDRDKGKRPLMGEVSARLADLSFVTSDNPRTENPDVIIDDVVEGMGDAPIRRFVDRKEAIGAALQEARPDDLVLLAGKGHEDYQVVGLEKLPFDESGIVREFLAIRDGGGRA